MYASVLLLQHTYTYVCMCVFSCALKRLALTIRVQMPFYMHNNFLFIFSSYLHSIARLSACMCAYLWVCAFLSLALAWQPIVPIRICLCAFIFAYNSISCAMRSDKPNWGTQMSKKNTYDSLIHKKYIVSVYFSLASANSSAILGAHFYVFICFCNLFALQNVNKYVGAFVFDFFK